MLGVHRAVYTVGVDENQAREILKSLRQEADEAQQAVVNARVRVAALGKLIEGYCELFPGLAKDVRRIAVEQAEATDAVPDRPTGQEAVLRVLSDITYRGRYWSPSMMVDELEGRGWSPRSDNPVNAVRTDVYKRQVPGHALRRTSRFARDARLFTEAMCKKGRRGSLWPVSYTHLDVYKRQLEERPLPGQIVGEDPLAELDPFELGTAARNRAEELAPGTERTRLGIDIRESKARTR